MNRLSIANLMTPEAKPSDSFNSSFARSQSQPLFLSSSIGLDNTLPPISAERRRSQSDMKLPSPPDTPFTLKFNLENNRNAPVIEEPMEGARDPVLFPRTDESSGQSSGIVPADQPLFAPPQPASPAATKTTAATSNSMITTETATEIAAKPVVEETEPVAEEPRPLRAALEPEPQPQARPQQPQPSTPEAVRSVIEEHIAKLQRTSPQHVQTPTREEYKLALECAQALKSNVVAAYNDNPGAYAKQEREYLDKQSLLMKFRLKKIAPAPVKRSQLYGVSAARPQRQPRSKRSPKSTPLQKPLDSFNATPTPTRATPKPRIGATRDDTHYDSLPDFSPPVETLGDNPKALKVEWKGQPLDLSQDPDREKLHPSEINLASTLRLSCATYLCSKRRIFQSYVNALRNGQPFRKTHAQQACKIDVNKASRLFLAFEKVGWINGGFDEHFRQFF
ncbi:hypothetical protein VTO42DRAFT_688 [Malbranchea cinnamomea]